MCKCSCLAESELSDNVLPLAEREQWTACVNKVRFQSGSDIRGQGNQFLIAFAAPWHSCKTRVWAEMAGFWDLTWKLSGPFASLLAFCAGIRWGGCLLSSCVQSHNLLSHGRANRPPRTESRTFGLSPLWEVQCSLASWELGQYLQK